jgi:hypothetical protein
MKWGKKGDEDGDEDEDGERGREGEVDIPFLFSLHMHTR